MEDPVRGGLLVSFTRGLPFWAVPTKCQTNIGAQSQGKLLQNGSEPIRHPELLIVPQLVSVAQLPQRETRILPENVLTDRKPPSEQRGVR